MNKEQCLKYIGYALMDLSKDKIDDLKRDLKWALEELED